MRPAVVFMILLTSCSIAFAKNPADTSGVGIFGGPNFNRLSYHDHHTAITGTNTGFHLAVCYDKTLNGQLSLQPAFVIVQLGGNIDQVDSGIHVRLLQVGLNLMLVYHYKNFLAGLGPGFFYGIHGTVTVNKHQANVYDRKEAEHLTLKPVEANGNVLLRYDFRRRFFLSASYSGSLINIYRGDGSAPSNLKAGTTMTALSAGYLF
jgi:hypothetical protein